MADHAKGAILTSAITDALEVGAGACLTPASGRTSTGDSGLLVPVSPDGPSVDRGRIRNVSSRSGDLSSLVAEDAS